MRKVGRKDGVPTQRPHTVSGLKWLRVVVAVAVASKQLDWMLGECVCVCLCLPTLVVSFLCMIG